MKNILPILSIAFLLTSCNCEQQIIGTVLDKDTNKPIRDVYVHEQGNTSLGEFTTEKGQFKLVSEATKILGCPGMDVTLNKDGYKTTTVSVPNAAPKTLYMEKLKR